MDRCHVGARPRQGIEDEYRASLGCGSDPIHEPVQHISGDPLRVRVDPFGHLQQFPIVLLEQPERRVRAGPEEIPPERLEVGGRRWDLQCATDLGEHLRTHQSDVVPDTPLPEGLVSDLTVPIGPARHVQRTPDGRQRVRLLLQLREVLRGRREAHLAHVPSVPFLDQVEQRKRFLPVRAERPDVVASPEDADHVRRV